MNNFYSKVNYFKIRRKGEKEERRKGGKEERRKGGKEERRKGRRFCYKVTPLNKFWKNIFYVNCMI